MQRAGLFGSIACLVCACGTAELRQPTFVPSDQLQTLQAALAADIPALWSEISFGAPPDKELLIVDLRLASGLSSNDFGTACSAASRSLTRLLAPNIANEVRLIREWRVIHVC